MVVSGDWMMVIKLENCGCGFILVFMCKIVKIVV